MPKRYLLRIIEKPEEMVAVEELQRLVWPGDETEIVPAHLLLTAAHNGGLVIGAYELGEGTHKTGGTGYAGGGEEEVFIPGGAEIPAGARLVGFVFGFPGLYFTPDGPRPKHCSHLLAVDPDFRDQGVGFRLKRAQWQMIRHQELDRATWTYDPLLSRNAHLNIARLGAVCNTYIREAYGEMRDALNVGFPSDRFQVDWWVNTRRVERRLSSQPRPPLELADYLEAGTPILNTSRGGDDGLAQPAPDDTTRQLLEEHTAGKKAALLLVEIPDDYMALKAANPGLALEWRLHTRWLFESLFGLGYLVTDMVYLKGKSQRTLPRSFYVLSYGESTL